MKNLLIGITSMMLVASSMLAQDIFNNETISIKEQAGAKRNAPEGYKLWKSDDFDTFNSNYWSRGLEDDTPGSDKKLIWNKTTGGANLLNDGYAGYITDEDSYIENGNLVLLNQKRVYQGVDPARQFNYTSGWINSCGKILFNGTEQGICLKLKAKFPVGKEVWPAIWLVTDAPHWPPEIDIWEYFGQFFNANNKQELMALRYIYGHWSNPINVKHELLSFDSDYDLMQWHEYSWEWTSESMIWKVDDQIVGTMTKGVGDNGTWPNKVIPADNWPNEDFALVINNGIMSELAGQGAVYPNSLVLDWLDIYKAELLTEISIDDPLDDLSKVESTSSNTIIFTDGSETFNSDQGRLARIDTETAFVIYKVNDIIDFNIEYWLWKWSGGGTLKVFGSSDGVIYNEIATSAISKEDYIDRAMGVIVPSEDFGCNYLKIELSGGDAGWKDQVGHVVIKSTNTTSILEHNASLPQLYAYPNPVGGVVYFNHLTHLTKVRVLNLAGSIVKQGFVTDRMDVSDLNPGVYLLKAVGYAPVKIVKK